MQSHWHKRLRLRPSDLSKVVVFCGGQKGYGLCRSVTTLLFQGPHEQAQLNGGESWSNPNGVTAACSLGRAVNSKRRSRPPRLVLGKGHVLTQHRFASSDKNYRRSELIVLVLLSFNISLHTLCTVRAHLIVSIWLLNRMQVHVHVEVALPCWGAKGCEWLRC